MFTYFPCSSTNNSPINNLVGNAHIVHVSLMWLHFENKIINKHVVACSWLPCFSHTCSHHATWWKKEVKLTRSTRPVCGKKFWGKKDKFRHGWVTRTSAFFLWPYMYLPWQKQAVDKRESFIISYTALSSFFCKVFQFRKWRESQNYCSVVNEKVNLVRLNGSVQGTFPILFAQEYKHV